MSSSVRIGRLAGVEVGIHWSWIVVVALIVWSLADQVFPETHPGLSDGVYVAMGIVSVALFFGSLLLHELGHARTALREGMEIEGITLWLFGGVARFRGAFPSATAELRIAAAGPLVTLVIAVIALATGLLVPLPEAVEAVILWLGQVNLLLLVFNLIPALPLDGGRILHAVLWRRRDDLLGATRTASAMGRGFGQFLIGAGVFVVIAGGAIGGLWFVFIGWFLLAAAEAELSAAETEHALRAVSVRDAMVVDPVSVEDSLSLTRFMDEHFLRERFSAYPVIAKGKPVGLVSFRSVLRVPNEEWPTRAVGEIMSPIDKLPVLAPDSPLGPALETLAVSPLSRTLVLAEGRLCGLLSITDATRLVEAKRAVARGGSHPKPEVAAPGTRPGTTFAKM